MPEITTADLAFPVLCLARDSSISVAHRPEDLAQCNALAFYRNRYFDQLHVIDSNAAPYVVTQARLDRQQGGVRRFLARLLNRRLIVVLRLAPAGPPSLADAKTHLISWVDREPSFWEASRDLEEWRRLIRSAPDIAALVRLFS